MAIIDLSTVQVDDLIPVLTNFKHCNQSILPFTLSGSSEAVFAELLEKAAIGPSAGCVEVSKTLLHHIVASFKKSFSLALPTFFFFFF